VWGREVGLSEGKVKGKERAKSPGVGKEEVLIDLLS
jgi:hypothetical protein